MKTLFAFLSVMLAIFFVGCPPCTTYNGYGRYTLRLNCDKVNIGGQDFMVSKQGTDLIVANHSFSRGIYRKTRPWLYLHHSTSDKVDITFEEGSKAIYPLYTGSTASIFEVYIHPWNIQQSTCAAFANNFWLVFHRWTEDGVLVDLQQQLSTVESWSLVQSDILLPANGNEVTVAQINTKMSCNSFNYPSKTATVKFTSIP